MEANLFCGIVFIYKDEETAIVFFQTIVPKDMQDCRENIGITMWIINLFNKRTETKVRVGMRKLRKILNLCSLE